MPADLRPSPGDSPPMRTFDPQRPVTSVRNRVRWLRLMKHYNAERLHATLGYMTPATWHRGHPEQVRERRAGQIAAARARRKMINQQLLTPGRLSSESLPFKPKRFVQVDKKRDILQ